MLLRIDFVRNVGFLSLAFFLLQKLLDIVLQIEWWGSVSVALKRLSIMIDQEFDCKRFNVE